ncbi:MAG TPA: hypothetical protein VGC98_11265 [Thermoleophilaceae bacterium]
MANVFDPDFDAEQDKPPFTWRRARLGRQAGAESLGASLLELPPLDKVVPAEPEVDYLDGER